MANPIRSKVKYLVFCVALRSGISDEAVDINISAPPKDGEANEELIDFLSDVLGTKKSNISLSKGSKARHKLV
jgi:uncharacterized protein (TIGR00251 family)